MKTKRETTVLLRDEFEWFLTQEFKELRQGIIARDNLEKYTMSKLDRDHISLLHSHIGEFSKLSPVNRPWTSQNKELDPLWCYTSSRVA